MSILSFTTSESVRYLQKCCTIRNAFHLYVTYINILLVKYFSHYKLCAISVQQKKFASPKRFKTFTDIRNFITMWLSTICPKTKKKGFRLHSRQRCSVVLHSYGSFDITDSDIYFHCLFCLRTYPCFHSTIKAIENNTAIENLFRIT